MAKTEETKAAEKAAKEQAKREELLGELAAFNITNTGGTDTIAPPTGDETVEKLAELLKAAKAAEKAAGSSGDPITVKYLDHKGEPTERTYSKEVHGEDFAKLADEFKATNASRIIA